MTAVSLPVDEPSATGRCGGMVVPLCGDGAPSSLVGGKAAALDRLIGWGVPVPQTAVVSTRAFRSALESPDVRAVLDRLRGGGAVSADDVDHAFAAWQPSSGLAAAIGSAAQRVSGGAPIAVRSSATVEDLGSSSFAGQYRSILDVDPQDPAAVVDAVKLVFASLLHPAPRAYREAFGVDSRSAAMAAVLMPMVNAVQAGVVFTTDPANPGLMRIETVRGTAESLVSGRQTPAVRCVPRGRLPADVPTDMPTDLPTDVPTEVGRILELALDIERRAGLPQDIEWAWDGTTVWIVQARPITVAGAGLLDEFDDEEPHLATARLTTAGIGEMLPGVLSPLVWQLCSHLVDESFRSMLDTLGTLPSDLVEPGGFVRRVNGRAALDLDRLGAAVATIPGVAQRMHEEFAGDAVSTPTPARRRGMVRRLFEARTARTMTRRASLDADIAVAAVAEIMRSRPDLGGASPSRLLTYHANLIDLTTRAMAAEVVVAADAGAIVAGLSDVLARWTTADRARALAVQATVPDVGTGADPRASAAVFAGPTWVELGLPDVSQAPPQAQTSAMAALLATLEDAPTWPEAGLRRRTRERRIVRLVTEATRQLERRDCVKSAILGIGGEVRRVHQELGRRLVRRGSLRHEADVELLRLGELRRLVRGGGEVAPAAIERRRRWLLRHESEPTLPVRFVGRPLARSAPPAVPGRDLLGWGASAGIFEGVARRADGPTAVVDRTEILVATATDPSWSPLLMTCGAMVIERGGPLSHAAILAREFGVPAVFNVPGAASLGGRRLRVDGSSGRVTVLGEGPEADAERR